MMFRFPSSLIDKQVNHTFSQQLWHHKIFKVVKSPVKCRPVVATPLFTSSAARAGSRHRQHNGIVVMDFDCYTGDLGSIPTQVTAIYLESETFTRRGHADHSFCCFLLHLTPTTSKLPSTTSSSYKNNSRFRNSSGNGKIGKNTEE